MTSCPIECIRPDEDFIQKNGAWLLTVIAGVSGCAGMMFTYFLKSRCKNIKMCGLSCERDVVNLSKQDLHITSSNTHDV